MYIITATVITNEPDGKKIDTCTWCSQCGNMQRALEVANTRAFALMDEVCADYISSVEVRRVEDEA